MTWRELAALLDETAPAPERLSKTELNELEQIGLAAIAREAVVNQGA